MLYISVLDSASFKKLSKKHCSSDKYGKFSTEREAKTVCAGDSNCKGVYDGGCDGRGSFYLCPNRNTYQRSISSCIHEIKMSGAGNCSNISYQIIESVRKY